MRTAAARASSADAAVAAAAAEAIEELEAIKADKGTGVALTIPATGWTAAEDDETGDADVSAYPYYLDIAEAGVTALDRVDVTVAPEGIEAATACGLCPVSETLAGVIRLRAVNAPTEAIAAEYWLHSGKE